jgi:ribosomal protein L29
LEEANELRAESLENDIVAVKKELTDLREKYALLRALFEAKTGDKTPGF